MRLKYLIKENQLECQVKSTTMWRLRQVALKSIYLANILHLNNQVSIQDVHCTPWTFRNHSQLSMDSSNCKSAIETYSMLYSVFGGMGVTCYLLKNLWFSAPAFSQL
jgi:hypothetical protein